MPKYRVTDPQTGRTLELTGDSPPTEAELEDIFAQQTGFAGGAAPTITSPEAVPTRIGQETPLQPVPTALERAADPTAGMTGGQLALAGAGKAFSDIGTAARQLLPGGATPEEIEERRRRDEPLMATGPGMAGNIAANIAAFAPTAMIPGAASMTGAALTGGAVGALTPQGEDTSKLGQIATGAALGAGGRAAFQGAGFVGRKARDLVDPFLPGGAQRAGGRALTEAAGPRREAIVKALRENVDPLATAGEAATPAGSAEFSALQRIASRQRPSEMIERGRATAAARTAQLDVLGTSDDLTNAIRQRASSAEPLYRAARRSEELADPSRTISLIDKITKGDPKNTALTRTLKQVRDSLFDDYPLSERAKDSRQLVLDTNKSRMSNADKSMLDSLGKILNRAKLGNIDEEEAFIAMRPLRGASDRAKEALKAAKDNIDFRDFAVTQNPNDLMSASRNIKALIDAKGPTGQRINETIVRELGVIKKSLDNQISKSVPEFREANVLFRELSRPVNQAQIGRQLRETLDPALTEAGANLPQRAQSFATALRDPRGLIKKATGFKRGRTLSDILEPRQLKAVDEVAKSLAKKVDFDELATAGMRKAGEIAEDASPGQIAPILERNVVIANALLGRTGKRATAKLVGFLSENMDDPQRIASLMESASPEGDRMINLIVNALRSGTPIAAAQGVQ